LLCPRLTSVVVLADGTIVVIYNFIHSERGESFKGMVWHLIAGLSFVFVVHRERSLPAGWKDFGNGTKIYSFVSR
jgi:hypothetical protein